MDFTKVLGIASASMFLGVLYMASSDIGSSGDSMVYSTEGMVSTLFAPASAKDKLSQFEEDFLESGNERKAKIKEFLVDKEYLDAFLRESDEGLLAHLVSYKISDVLPSKKETSWELKKEKLGEVVFRLAESTAPLSSYFEEIAKDPIENEATLPESLTRKFSLIKDTEFIGSKSVSVDYLMFGDHTGVEMFDVSSPFNASKGSYCVALRFKKSEDMIVQRMQDLNGNYFSLLFRPERVIGRVADLECQNILIGAGFISNHFEVREL